TFAVVWANSVAPDLAQVISTNRGASEGAAAFASAYSLGRQESAAAVNLLKKVPPVVKDTLTTLVQFELRHGDADILAMLEHGVPPVDLGNCIRLNAQLLQTTWQQTELQMKSDLELLKGWGRKFDLHASQQGSLDFKFISDRYNRGKSEVEKLMTEKHVLHSCASITMAHAPIVNMQQQMGHSGLTLLIVDATLWPSRAVAIDEAIQMCQAISTGNCRTLAFILLPQPYNTGHKALVNKHRRLLEDKVHGFAEWGFASWAMQLERLSAEDPTSTDLDLRFLAVYHSDSAAELSAYENSVKGKMMADWWDKSTVAGPK
ncbi:unnamed protein product, partial [Durusdinium trenchii]